MGLKIVVHKIPMGDVEDPEIYAAEPIIAFEKTAKGQWLHKHSCEQMTFNIYPNPETYGWVVVITAWLEEQDLTYYKLKWGE
jgi:hypothetical protein